MNNLVNKFKNLSFKQLLTIIIVIFIIDMLIIIGKLMWDNNVFHNMFPSVFPDVAAAEQKTSEEIEADAKKAEQNTQSNEEKQAETKRQQEEASALTSLEGVKKNIVGTWEYSAYNEKTKKNEVVLVYEFSKDGRFVARSSDNSYKRNGHYEIKKEGNYGNLSLVITRQSTQDETKSETFTYPLQIVKKDDTLSFNIPVASSQSSDSTSVTYQTFVKKMD